MSINHSNRRYNIERNCNHSDFLHASIGYSQHQSGNLLTSSPISINSTSYPMEKETSPDFLQQPLIQSLQPLKRSSSRNNNISGPTLQKKISIKDVFTNRKQNVTLPQLAQVKQKVFCFSECQDVRDVIHTLYIGSRIQSVLCYLSQNTFPIDDSWIMGA